jgi:hypothetical protein
MAASAYLPRVPPALTVVVVAYDMARELPRTLRSLASGYQRGMRPDDYVVVVVDNGSPEPPDAALIGEFPGRLRLERRTSATPSPAAAANLGIAIAQGDLIGLLIDGARLASPGLLRLSLLAARLAERPVIATLGWHLGEAPHMEAAARGYDQTAEDRLLAEAGWEEDGYRLFALSSLSGSSRRGWFGPMGESNALFMPRGLWDELGGLEEAFSLPGGGLVNHDLYRRACTLSGVQLIVMLGEGTFHQVHGGASTSRRVPRSEAWAEYEGLRGEAYEPPQVSPLYLGSIPEPALPHLEHSLRWACRAANPNTPLEDPPR